MNRKSLLIKFSRLFQKLPLSVLRLIEKPLAQFIYNPQISPKIIIIIALPRSGSTLTYQLLNHCFDSLYLSNLWNLLYQIPLFGGLLSSRICNDYKSHFISDQGFVKGICGPSEGLKFWSYWSGIGIDDSKNLGQNNKRMLKRKKYINKVFSSLSSPTKPIVTGYIGHILNIKSVQLMFPNAIFVRLSRDPLANAISIFNIRKNKKNWFSVYPQECEKLINENIYKQVASQVYWLNKRIDKDLCPYNTIDITYEKLCDNPAIEINRIIDFCNKNDFNISMKSSCPEKFKYTSVVPSFNEHTKLLASELSKLRLQLGELSYYKD